MSKEPVTPQEGGEPPSHARGVNAAPSQPPGTRRSRHASVQSERQAVQGARHDGAGTSAAMAAHQGGHDRRVTLQVPSREGGQLLQRPGERQDRAYQGDEHPPGQGGGAGFTRPPTTAGRNRPSYVPPSQRRREQPPPYAPPPPSRPAVGQPTVHGPYPLGGVQDERLATPPPQAGAGAGALPPMSMGGLPIPEEDALPPRKPSGPKKENRKPTFWGAARTPVAHQHPLPGEDSPAAPVGAAAAGGGSHTTPGGAGAPPRGRMGVPTAKTIERVSTLEFTPVVGEHDKYQHPYPPPQEEEPYPRMKPSAGPSPGKNGRPSPLLLPQRKKKRRPAAFCFTLCCILFWLLVVGLGVAILVVYLLYHPQPPRLRVTTATLNAGYVDQLPPPRGGLALNSDLYVLATLYNPNTKVDVVLRYMQLDLYFHGVMIGTQAVWPPIHEDPGESALRSVHLVVSEVRMSQEVAEAWHNATARNGLVELQLRSKFHVQLNFGRWLPFRYWVYPTCSLWLDPPPGGALRRARCRKSP